MKKTSVLMLVLLAASALTLGCVNLFQTATPTPVPTPAPTITPIPTITVTPSVSTSPPTSAVYMPEQTTNGRPVPSATVTAIANGSKGPITGGELAGNN